MRPAISLGMVAIAVTILLLAFGTLRSLRSRGAGGPGRTHVVLIGASIGQSWRLAEWPLRVNAPAITAESIAEWQFDKTEAVEALLMRPKIDFALSRAYLQSFISPPQRPDIVILKECSSYFPGPLPDYQDRIRRWVTRLREHRLSVALATVAPVTRARSVRDLGKQEGILEFNAWLRQFARGQRLTLVDLEAVLREEQQGSYLREQFAAPDGSHLNAAAYRHLDRALLEALCPSETATLACHTATEPVPGYGWSRPQ